MAKKHTYELKFGTGSYAEILPTNSVTTKGEWIVGTNIWRESITELKIGRLKNPTIYDALESWFSDNTKFETKIFVRILKNSVEQSVHWFGVKWGTIDKRQKTYIVNPTIYDALESWFSDNTKFETKIFVRILKNSVEQSVHRNRS